MLQNEGEGSIPIPIAFVPSAKPSFSPIGSPNYRPIINPPLVSISKTKQVIIYKPTY